MLPSTIRDLAFSVFFLFVIASCQSISHAVPGDSLITITGVGDIMMGTHFPSTEYLPPFDGARLFDGVTEALSESDIVFGNLEGSLLDEGECIKSCENPEACFAFKMPERYVHHLKRAGFNLLSIANNHIGDFGLPGRNSTYRLLDEANIAFAGIDSKPYSMFKYRGVTYGFTAFAPNVGTPDIRDLDAAATMVRKLDERCDIVIVSFHGGAEGIENRHITREDEEYYGENRGNVYAFAHTMIDAGADVVFGHGPHVTRAAELYKGRFIAYSLGNFCTYGRFNLLSSKGVAPIIRLRVDRSGAFHGGKVIPVYQEHLKAPKIDPENRALLELIELTTADFPETPLLIRKTGELEPIKEQTGQAADQ